MPNRRADRDPYDYEITPMERFCMGFFILFVLLAVIVSVSGCANPNTGTCTVIGEQLALPEITDASDSISVRVYETIKGARVWTAKDSVVTVEYHNAYTNSYFGMVDTTSDMRLKVKVEPCEVAAEPSAAFATNSDGGQGTARPANAADATEK